MEIRVKVEEYVNQKILALRQNHPGSYDNVSILRMNAMKFLPNFFEKHQVGYPETGSRKTLTVGIIDACLF
jgi:tRNA (guanine-N7-)-methyltransferase